MSSISPIRNTFDQAKEFALDILQPISDQPEHSSDNRVVVYHHYDPFFYWWPSYHHCGCSHPISFGSGGSSTGKKNDLPVKLILGVGAIVALATAYFLGVEVAKRCETNRCKNNLEDQKAIVLNCNELGKNEAVTVINFEEKMLDSVKTDTTPGILAKSALIGSTVLAGAGAIVSGPLLVTAGVVGGIVSSTALLFRWGFMNNDTALKENAQRLLQMVNQAERQIGN